jgi:acyl carrier protein
MDKAINALRNWIVERHPEIGRLAEDQDIIESRIVTSLEFVELLSFVERLSGEPIPADQISLASFRTLRDIADNFLADVDPDSVPS